MKIFKHPFAFRSLLSLALVATVGAALATPSLAANHVRRAHDAVHHATSSSAHASAAVDDPHPKPKPAPHGHKHRKKPPHPAGN
jgi:ABC-type nickel/cobalt efflux system permease component RcnA